jgi:hypothetical protein
MDKLNKSDMIIYNDGELELSLSVNDETLWLTQKQIAELFQVTIPNINMHIKSIYKEEELFENRTIQKYLIVQKEGKREVKREVEHYNLDVVLSVGYRVNSKKATTFRQWATKILKSYITDGYVINSDKITNDRFLILDEKEIYHIGASLKDLGKKWFVLILAGLHAFSLLDLDSFQGSFLDKIVFRKF